MIRADDPKAAARPQTQGRARPGPSLKDVRRAATGLLAAMVLLLAASSALMRIWPWIGFLRAFSEAATVGACADWFAVTALFHHPFGLPIPHTAIIPRQKERIGEATGRFISDNFLHPDVVAGQIEGLDLAGFLLARLRLPEDAAGLGAALGEVLEAVCDAVGTDRLAAAIERGLLETAAAVKAAPAAGRLLQALLDTDQFDPLFVRALGEAQRFLATRQDAIRKQFAKSGGGWIPGWIDGRLADAVLGELLATLTAAEAQADHPWRQQSRSALERFARSLGEDPRMLQAGERLKAHMLASHVPGPGGGVAGDLGRTLAHRLRASLASRLDTPAPALVSTLRALASWLEEDPGLAAAVNERGRALIVALASQGRDGAGRFAAQVISRWDATTLVDRLEQQVGRDLQYIRINGTLVGGLVGLAIYGLSKLWP